MSGISTHILDTAHGWPAAGVKVHLFLGDKAVGSGTTDEDGRIQSLLPVVSRGTYRLLFEIGPYFPEGFYSEVSISFRVLDDAAHYHIPLLISPFGYATYRGS